MTVPAHILTESWKKQHVSNFFQIFPIAHISKYHIKIG